MPEKIREKRCGSYVFLITRRVRGRINYSANVHYTADCGECRFALWVHPAWRSVEIPSRRPSGSDDSRRSTESVARRIIHTGFCAPTVASSGLVCIIARARPAATIPEKFRTPVKYTNTKATLIDAMYKIIWNLQFLWNFAYLKFAKIRI